MKAKANKISNTETPKIFFTKKLKSILVLLSISLIVISILQINFDTVLPIKKIRAQGEFENVTEKMILEAIADDISSGYLNVDVHDLQLKIEQLPWVKIATVRRVWPDSIVVTIKEQKAYAIWNNTGLLNESGDTFEPKTISNINLPLLNGPKDLNVKVMNEYKIIESKLNEIGFSINEFTLDARRAVNMQLSNNITVSLGRTKYYSRLARFITAFKFDLKKYTDKIEYVDMRYTNGFSVKWKENRQAAKKDNVLRGVLDV